MNNQKYQENLRQAMYMLAKEKETIFIGQTIIYGGSPVFGSCIEVPIEKKIELPVFEDTQMGISLGLSLEGFIPISIFPRMDFLICGINQLVNHIDKCEEMSKGEFCPGIIIRTQIGNIKPLYPGCQHCGDYTQALKKMLKNVEVIKIKNENKVIPSYELALQRAKNGLSTLLIEVPTGVFGRKK
jgi:pyruvate/2-oxoglutarate/acetoin dehydrogenase E1 component